MSEPDTKPEPARPGVTQQVGSVRLTDAQQSARKRRNVWIFWALLGFIGLIFLTTVLRLGANIAAGGA